ncbi:MAG: hypothetical protein ACXWUG_24670 [Polyangiales bacterium]
MARGSSAFGTVVAAVAVLALSWLALRSMTDKQKAAFADAGAAENPVTPIVPTIPPALVGDAKTPVARLDVVLRVDGVEATLDGAPICRDGHRRLVGRAPGGANGSFDEPALIACVRAAKPQGKKTIALVTRAGPAVPTTFQDALIAALKRAGADEVVPP